MAELTFLSPEESELLLGLAMAIISADGSLSGKESEALRRLGLRMGPTQFVEAAQAARVSYPDDERALAAAEQLKGQRAREAIYRTLSDLANADGVSGEESEVLSKLAEFWGMGPR